MSDLAYDFTSGTRVEIIEPASVNQTAGLPAHKMVAQVQISADCDSDSDPDADANDGP